MLSGHGSDIYSYKKKIIADFSSNVWYKGIPDGLAKHLKNCISNIVHYPEPDAGGLANKIAKLHNMGRQNVLVTNGATEAFYLLAHAYTGHDSHVIYPSFSEYADACKIFDHKVHFINGSEFIKYTNFNAPSLVWVGNPNNPDGKVIPRESIEYLCKNNPGIIFIIDEAYAELCASFGSVIGLVGTFPNLIVVRSLTKALSIPGIRLGYMAASFAIIEKVTMLRMPWSVNLLAIEAGNFILSNYDKLLPDKKELLLESTALQNEFASIPGLQVTRSDCNFFLVKLKKGESLSLKQYLIEKHGLLVRDASNFTGLDDTYFRIAIQKSEFNKQLISAIKNWLKI